MLEFIKNPTAYQTLSLIGVLFAVGGALLAACFYRGKQGEKYSPLNHFISELGEKGVSRLAIAFNFGLIVSGSSLVLAAIILGCLVPGVWAKLGLAAGVVSGIGLALVGVYPMNNLKPHARAAMTYFRAGLLMILFFSIAIAVQPAQGQILPSWVSLVGLPAILAFGFFLIYTWVTFKPHEEPLSPLETQRPRFWGMAAAEWMIFLTTVPWILVVALMLR